MSDDVNSDPLNTSERHTSYEEFSNFCLEEKERMMNSGDDFDEKTFDEARELTLRKLKVLAAEGWS